eukprot:jgi/Mesvir1/11691/Mv00083-RA.1
MAVLGTACSLSHLLRADARIASPCTLVPSTSARASVSPARLNAPLTGCFRSCDSRSCLPAMRLQTHLRLWGPHQPRLSNHSRQTAVRASADNTSQADNETSKTSPEVAPPVQSIESSRGGNSSTNKASSGNDKGLFSTMLAVAVAGCGLTAYLSYSKLAGHAVYCPVGGCNDVLNSSYATVLGLPLPLYGFSAYASVAAMATVLRKQASEEGVDTGASWSPKLILFGLTSLMACVSGFLMTILATQLHEECAYCTTSALFSAMLFGLSLKSLSSQELKKALVPDVAVCASTLIALSLLVSAQPDPAQASSSRVESPSFIPYYPTEVTTTSPPNAVGLAKHLREIGAKMYGAFWCSHCAEQKEVGGQKEPAGTMVERVQGGREGRGRGWGWGGYKN